MGERIKQFWYELKVGKPGHRFKNRYRRRQRGKKGHIVWRIFLITLGAFIAVSSLILAPLPGPGWVTVFIGLMILAGELLLAARFLDWLEVRLRKLWWITWKLWRRSVSGKIAVVAVAAICVAAIGYVGYVLLFGGSLF